MTASFGGCVFVAALALGTLGCGSDSEAAGGTGGNAGVGGSAGSAGAAGMAGVGGSAGTGGEAGSGGSAGSGAGGALPREEEGLFGEGWETLCQLGLCEEDPELGVQCQEAYDVCVGRGHYPRSCRMDSDQTCGVSGQTGAF